MPIETEVKTEACDALIGRLQRADDIVRKAAFSVQAHAQVAITTGQKTGRLYKRGKKGVHQASAPGEAPANDTSALANGIQASKIAEAEWQVASSAKQSAALELVKNRPFMLPALMAVKDAFIEAARKLIEG